jgi:hypothetical protein
MRLVSSTVTPQALIEQLRQGGRIEVELQMPISVALFQLIANQLGSEGCRQPALDLAHDLILFPVRLFVGEIA